MNCAPGKWVDKGNFLFMEASQRINEEGWNWDVIHCDSDWKAESRQERQALLTGPKGDHQTWCAPSRSPQPSLQSILAKSSHLSRIRLLFFFLGLHLRHMEVPRLGVESELQLLAYTTATVMPDPSRICNLHHSSWQCWILNSMSEIRDQTCILMDSSQILFC